MKNRLFLVLWISVLSVFLFSCKGDPGSAGADGATGPTGANTSVMMFQQGVYPSDAYSGVSDNVIISLNKETNYGSDTSMTIGAVAGGKYRPIIKFDIQSLVPSNVTVSKAYLDITLNGLFNNTINAYAISNFWNETESCWTSRTAAATWTTEGGDYSELQDSKGGWESTKITLSLNPSLVQGWLSNPSANHGIILIGTQETGTLWRNVYSSENLTRSNRPKLTIYYTLP